MDLRRISTERLLAVTARLLAVAAVLVVVGLGLVVRFMWQQSRQAFGPGGDGGDSGVSFGTRVTIMVFDTGYRPIGVQLLLAAVLVAAAVAAIPRRRTPSPRRSVRWEVLGAGALVLVAVVGFASVLLYVVTSDAATTAQASGFGPMPMTALMWANTALCAASLAVLAGAGLWWLRLGQEPDDAEEPADEDAAPEHAEGPHDTEPVGSSRDARDAWDDAGDDAVVDYSRDWSPEDFRPPH